MIGSVSYVGMNVRVWCMCSGRVLYMIAFYTSCLGGGGGGGGSFKEFSLLV